MSSVLHPIQTQFDAVIKELQLLSGELQPVQTQFDDLTSELQTCLKSDANELIDDITLQGPHTFNGATAEELIHLSCVTSAIQAQFDNVTSELQTCSTSGVNELTDDITLQGPHTFSGATAAHLSGVTSAIQAQFDDVTSSNLFKEWCK